jgi:hypothetical protein
MTGFIEHLSAEGCIEDGTLASDLTKVNTLCSTCSVAMVTTLLQAKALWAIREEIAVALVCEGVTYKVTQASVSSSCEMDPLCSMMCLCRKVICTS